MHPVLFTIALPTTQVPLFPALLGLVVLGVCLAAYARWRKIAGLLVFGAALAAVAGYAAHAFRDQTLVLATLEVPTWGAFMSLWLILAWQLVQVATRRLALPAVEMANCVIVSALGGLLSARILFVLTTLHEGPELEWLALRQGGLLGIAAVAGCVAVAALYLRRRKLSLWQWLDVTAPTLALGVVLVRAGCYLHGCDFGHRLAPDSPEWLARLGTFPRWGDPDQAPVGGALAWVQQVLTKSLDPASLNAHPVHPTQLYEALSGLALLALCWYGMPRRRFNGQLGLTVLLAYSLSRFVLEALRDDQPRGDFGPHLTLGVYLPLGLLLFAVALAYGPALSIARVRRRYVVMLLSVLPAAVALVLTWRHSGPATQLSATQWLALLFAGGAAHAWSLRTQAEGTSADAALTRTAQGRPRWR